MVGARRRARAQHRHALAALGRGDARSPGGRRTSAACRSCSTRSAPARRGTAPRRRKRILDEVDVAVLRGNAGEVATLVGVEAEVRGVESIGAGGDPAELAREAAARRSASSRRSPGRSTTSPTASASSRSRTATRCSRRSPAPAACRARSPAASSRSRGRRSTRAVEALVAFGVAGEDAAADAKGPGSFHVALYDALAALDPATLDGRARVA